jgi:hypothetical protein
MSDDRRRDGSKPSFSELDKRRKGRRDRRDDNRPKGSKRVQERAAKTYRAALEKAFEEGRVEEFAATLTRANERKLRLTDRPAAAMPAPSGTSDEPQSNQAGIPPAAPEELAAEEKKRAAGRKEQAKRRELQKKIREATHPRDVSAAVDLYVARFGSLPRDFELLEKALHHRSAEVVLRALRDLEARLASEKPRRSRSLSMRLALLEDTHDDDEIRELAAMLRKVL